MQTASTLTPAKSPLEALLPYAALVGAMLVIAGGATFAKSLFHIVGPQAVTAYRVGFAAVILVAVFRPWRMKPTRDDLLRVGAYGAVMGLMNLTFYLALQRLPIGITVAIEFLGPLSLSLALSRRPMHFVAIGLAAIGVALLLPIWNQGRGLDPVGVGFALAAGVCWALYILLAKRTSHLPGGQSVALGMAVAALVTVPFGLHSAGAGFFQPQLILGGLIVAILSSAIPYSLEMVAMRRIPARNFGVLLSLEPAIGAISAMFVLGEFLTAAQWGAILLVVAASALAVGADKAETSAATAQS
jgi:inner membrane transporter RhtA